MQQKLDIHSSAYVWKTPYFGSAGVILGFIGLGLAIFSPAIVSRIAPLPLNEQVSVVIADSAIKIKDRLKDRLLHKVTPTPAPATRPPPTLSEQLSFASLACAFVSLVLSSVSWLQHERRSVSCIAAAVSIGTLAWNLLILAIAAVVVLLILGIVFSFFNFFDLTT